ncbi:MAG: Nif11-like leader peptide family RiPP precursor, partial [Peptococcaceae bacterium]|nr:Nif11-like leader peptide family RiPP precursor [Peptococcaceae bacterium]
MTVEQAKLFLDALKTDAALQQKVREAGASYVANALLPIAKEAGF